MYRSLGVLAGFIGLTCLTWAQNATGTLDGRVTDASNSAVPGAAVTVESQATNVHWSLLTNAEGRFYQRYLQPGTYRVTVEKTGFQKYVQSDILLDVEQTVSLNVSLRLGDVSTTVEVEAAAAQLSTETSTVATTVSNKAVLDLPLGGNRSPLSLVTLVPGVIPSAGSNSPWISGGRNDYNDVTIDGTSVIVPENNVSHLQIGYVPNEDSVQEMSIVTNSLAPEYGRTGGGTINIATRVAPATITSPSLSSSGTICSIPIAGEITATVSLAASCATTSSAALSAARCVFPGSTKARTRRFSSLASRASGLPAQLPISAAFPQTPCGRAFLPV